MATSFHILSYEKRSLNSQVLGVLGCGIQTLDQCLSTRILRYPVMSRGVLKLTNAYVTYLETLNSTRMHTATYATFRNFSD